MNERCLSTRVRIARNFEDIPYRAMMTPAQTDECARRALSALRQINRPARYYAMNALTPKERARMVEKRLISPELASDDQGGALISEDERVSVMLCEEDHLRIQAIEPAMRLDDALDVAFEIDDMIERAYKMAYDTRLGYLSACPTNVGTGLRASVMLHLPMLSLRKEMGKVGQLAGKLGLTLRGMYGESSQALGGLYQLSNQVTLGRSEREIVSAVHAVGNQVMDMERARVDAALKKDRGIVEDPCWRALGIARYARRMGLKEFMTHYSSMRMGVVAGILPLTIDRLDALLVRAQPAHLQFDETGDRNIDQLNEDRARADAVRAWLTEG